MLLHWNEIVDHGHCLLFFVVALLQQEEKAADEKARMFHELLRIAQTDQVLKRYHLDTPSYLELSGLGASLLLTLYTDLPVAKPKPSTPLSLQTRM